MQNVSADYERLINSSDKWFESKLVIDGVGEYGENKLFSISTSIEMFHGQPEIGTAVSAEINTTLTMPTEDSIPRMACLRPYVRAKGTGAKSSAVNITGDKLSSQYASYSSEKITFAAGANASVSGEILSFPVDGVEALTSEWIPQGVFYIDTRETTANPGGVTLLKLHGYDAMLKTEQEYSSNDVVGDAKDKLFVQAIADAIGVEVDSRTWDIMGQGNVIPFPLGYTMREILGYIASSYVGSFIVTDEGKLRLVSLLGLPEHEDTSLLCTDDRYVILFGGDAILV